MKSSFYFLIILVVFTACGGGGSSTNISIVNGVELDTSSPISVSENGFEFGKAQPIPNKLLTELNVGFGGRNAYPFSQEGSEYPMWITSVELMLNEKLSEERRFQNIKNFNPEQFTKLQKYLVNSKYLSYWIPRGWQESWYSPSKIQEAMDKGYIPIFIYYYFGDRLDAIPTGELLESYYADNKRVSKFLQDLNGTKLFIMETEFNKDEIIQSEETLKAFGDVIAQGIENIEQNVSDIYFSLCMTDKGRREVNVVEASCGYDNCALGDKASWGKANYIYDYLGDKLSFISFQEMVAQFSRNPKNPGSWDSPNPRAFDEEYSGINYLDERILNFTQYLYERFRKPVMIPYMTIPTATWVDHDNSGTISAEEMDKEGWKEMPEKIYKGLKSRREELKESGMLGYLPMSLFDDPRQDYGGYQYFMDNEYHFGLIQTSAEDEVDKYIYGDLEFKGNVLEEIFGSLPSH